MNTTALTSSVLKCRLCAVCLFTLLASTAARGAEITKVLVRQQWPWNNKINIDYTLTGTGDFMVDVTPTIQLNGDAIDVPAASLSGDTEDVTAGERRIVWDPSLATIPDGFSAGDITVSLDVTTNKWLVIDLSAGPTATSYPATLQGKPVGGWTDDTYKTTKLVMRRIPAGSFVIGSASTETNRDASWEAQSDVTLTKDFYIAIYEMTHKQYELVTGTNNATSVYVEGDLFPARGTWSELRGIEKGNLWPSSSGDDIASSVDSGSFMDVLRTKVSLPSEITDEGYVFDLPTEAQWEYACRAGTTTAWNNGTDISLYPSPSNSAWALDGNLHILGWYRWNTGNNNKTRQVGLKLPNAWGLYDMHGNAPELCLNVHNGTSASGGTDPQGANKVSSYPYRRVIRGASSLKSPAEDCRSAARDRVYSATASAGIRLTLHDAQ